MARHTATDTTGCVVWPTGGRDTGEGGMTVYAVWVKDPWPDRFITCSEGANISMSLNETLIDAVDSGTGDYTTHSHLRSQFDDEEFLAAIILGSSGGAWYSDATPGSWNGEYFTARMENLTNEGRAIVDHLNKMYGRDAILLTILDT